MLKIEFDASNKPLAAAIGQALLNYADAKLDPASAAIVSQVKANHSDPKQPDGPAADLESHASAPGSDTPSESNLKTHSETQSETQTGGSITTAQSADPNANYAFEQHWLSASGQDYAGHPLHAEYGVPVDDKGYPLIDTFGVKHDPDWCQKAAKPFYASGKDKGKWKAKVGTDKDAFAAWHAAQLEQMGKPTTDAGTAGPTDEPQADAAGAFGGGAGTAPANDAAPVENLGDLMAWIGEMQTAGHIGQPQCEEAYHNCGTNIAELAAPNNRDKRVAVHAYLQSIIES
ncbi:hypothetical protein [Vibrio phage VP16T]|nr:hypothetical protein [Vibrio phage VP16T]